MANHLSAQINDTMAERFNDFKEAEAMESQSEALRHLVRVGLDVEGYGSGRARGGGHTTLESTAISVASIGLFIVPLAAVDGLSTSLGWELVPWGLSGNLFGLGLLAALIGLFALVGVYSGLIRAAESRTRTTPSLLIEQVET